MKTKSAGTFCAASLAAGFFLFGAAFAAGAASIFKADVADPLNLGASWVANAAPGSADVAVWDHTVVNNLSSSPGAGLDWSGIQILDPAGPVTINADGNSLTNGAAGIDLGQATTGLTLDCPIVLGADQTWTVAGGKTLAAAGVVSGAGVLTLTGGGLISLSGANTYSGGTIISAATVEPDNATCFGPAAANVTNTDDCLLFDIFPNSGIIANRNYVNGTTTIDMSNRGVSVVMDGAWAGGGTILITNLASGATLTLGGNGTGGDMNSFTGSVVVSDVNSDGNPSGGAIRFNNGGSNHNIGNSNAVFNLGQGGAQFTEKNGGVTTYFGALIGGPNTQLSKNENYVIGGANLDTTFAGLIQSSSSLTKVGAGRFTLSGNNAYTGTTTVRSGILQIGDGTTGGTGTLGTGAVVNDALLVFNRPDDVEVDNAISGSGITEKDNANTLTYGGADTSSGVLLIDQGSVALNAFGSVSGSIAIAAGASFDVTQNSAFVLGSTLSGFGTVLGPLTASGGALSPGGDRAAGTLTFANGLTESGGVTHQMELSTAAGTNDQIAVVGDLTLSGQNTILASAFGGGNIPVGTYPLITYTGKFNGSLDNLSVSISGGLGILTNPPGEIALIVMPPPRGPTNLTWLGDGVANAWDINSSTNWINGAASFIFLNGDSVTFDDTGAAHSTVNIAQTVLPSSVTVNATGDYTFSGPGEINGAATLLKTNSGTLTILTTNSYTGPTLLAAGTLAVMDLENGSMPSSIGAANSDPTNLVVEGATLNYLGAAAATDRGATLAGAGATVDVVDSGANLALNGTLAGAGGLTLSGPGTLTLGAANTYSGGTIISNGVLALGSNGANSAGLGGATSPVTFYGGTLQLFGFNDSTANHYNTPSNPLMVPAGQVGTLQLFPRGPTDSTGLASPLTGAGTLNLVVNYLRDNLDGDWSGFSGLINVTPKPSGSGDEMRINNGFGYANAAIYLNDGVLLDRGPDSSPTIDIGELGGTSGAIVGPGSKSAANPVWRIGWKNTTNTFAGTIADDGISSVVKVGAGEWILTGQNTYSGSTVISNGVLALAAGPTGDGSIGSSTNLFVAGGAILDVSGRSDQALPLSGSQLLSGRGTVLGSVDETLGGTIAPGDGLSGGTGTLTITNAVTLNGAPGAWLKLNRGATPNSDRIAAAAIVINGGSLTVVNAGPALHAGDTFTLFSGPISGSGFTGVALPDYYTWNTNQLYVNGSISVASVLPPPALTNVNFSQIASGSVTLDATGGIPNGVVVVLTSTNLSLPLPEWTPVATNNFDANGNLTGLTVPDEPGAPQEYYLLEAY